jgi:hypothetical protein
MAMLAWRRRERNPPNSANDDNVALSVRHHLLAHRPQEQARKATVATAPHHEQVGAAREVDQNLRGVALDDAGVDRHLCRVS